MPGHLIHIGFPKTGSTFLQEWFKLHPGMYYNHGGLGGFYTVYEISRRAAENDDLDFSYFVTSDEGLSAPTVQVGSYHHAGMLSVNQLIPRTSANKNVCEILRSLHPNARILLVARSYPGLLTSGYSEFIKNGGILTFSDFTDNLYNEIGGALNYTETYNMYVTAFGKENVLLLPYELLSEDQAKFLSVIEEWLGLAHIDIPIGRINESLSPMELYWYHKVSSKIAGGSRKLGRLPYKLIFGWYGTKMKSRWLKKLVHLFDKIKPGKVFDPADFSPQLLELIRKTNDIGGSDALKENPLFEPYLKEYLIK